VDGIADIELQKYLRLHAATDDFAKTVSKARQFVDANELSRTTKKPAIRSPNVNYQTIVDAVSEALNQRDRDRAVDVNLVQSANYATSDNRKRKASPRQGSPAHSNSSAGSASGRASTPTRTVRFQDQVESGSASGRGRWQGNQSPSGNGNNQRPWAGQRPQGQRSPSPRPPHQVKVALDLCRHRRKDSGRPVKVPRVCVHRLHPTQEIGGQVGDRLAYWQW